jgi:hypothetical protein
VWVTWAIGRDLDREDAREIAENIGRALRDHALRLTASMQGQLALLVRFQWVAGQRAAALMSAGPFLQ